MESAHASPHLPDGLERAQRGLRLVACRSDLCCHRLHFFLATVGDEAAAKLIDFLLQLAHQLENHYSEQLYRYHNGIDERQPDRWSHTDPPL